MYFNCATSVRSIFIVVCVDIVFSPTLSVGGTVRVFRSTCFIVWESHCQCCVGQENADKSRLVEKHWTEILRDPRMMRAREEIPQSFKHICKSMPC